MANQDFNDCPSHQATGWRKFKARVIPISEPVIELLEDLRRLAGSEYVLPSIKSDGPLVGLQKAWEGIRKKARLVDVRLHN